MTKKYRSVEGTDDDGNKMFFLKRQINNLQQNGNGGKKTIVIPLNLRNVTFIRAERRFNHSRPSR